MTRHVEVMELVAQLKAAEQTFVLATVVRTVSVTAAKAGAKAIIRPDGTIVAGWIGGGCARGAVLKAAREALVDGEPRMVSVQPENLLAELGVKPGENRDGVRFAQNMCPSKGTMDVFVEPVLPHPSLIVLGGSPVALSLATQARQLGYHVTVAAPAADLPGTPDADALIDGFELGRLHEARRFIVVSTQGKGDEAALRAAVHRRRLSCLCRQPPQDGSAARQTRSAKASTPAAIDRIKAPGRPRSRRHHAGGNRDVDLGRDHHLAPAGTAHSQSAIPRKSTMQMNDSQRIPASREKVWAALNDPQVLKQCIPGCQNLEMSSPTEMTATVVFRVGPVKATFGGKVTLSDLDPPNSYRISGEGSGGVAGFAKGGATVRLESESPEVTILHYEVDAQIGGKLAQLGQRLIDLTARKLAGEFFVAFGAVVGGTAEAPHQADAAPAGWLARLRVS